MGKLKRAFINTKTFIAKWQKVLALSFVCLFILSSISIYFTFVKKAYAATCGGAVVCACGDTVTSDYVVPANLSCGFTNASALTVGASNITIDGNGHSISVFIPFSNKGIKNIGYSNVTIKNFSNISGYQDAVYFSGVGTDHGLIKDNTIGKAIRLEVGSDYTIVQNNTVTSAGIALTGVSNVTVTGNTASSGSYGIQLSSSTGNAISGNTTNSNTSSGIYLASSTGNTISNNTSNSNTAGSGIYLTASTGNTILGNTANSNTYGINLVTSSTSNTVTSNAMSSNTSYALNMDDASMDNTITGTTNTTNGKTIIIQNGISDQTFDGNTLGGIALFWCTGCDNVTVQNATLETNVRRGIYLKNTNHSTVQNITMSLAIIPDASLGGITLDGSSSNIITGNNISNAATNRIVINGIYVTGGSGNIISNNITSSCASHGIHVNSSNNNTISGNIASNSTLNSTMFSGVGIGINGGSGNTLTSNTTNFNPGSGVEITGTNHILTGNIASYNNIGINLSTTGTALTGNTMLNNKIAISGNNSSNTYFSNQFLYNTSGGMVTFNNVTRVKNLNDSVSFDINMLDGKYATCSDCTYSITTNPSETVTANKSADNVTGSFTATQPGTYSLVVNVTDTVGNTTKDSYYYYIDSTSETVRYYPRMIHPTHGQPYGTGVDNGVLLRTPPASSEIIECTGWVDAAVDTLPNHPMAFITDINAHIRYRADTTGTTYLGFDRIFDYLWVDPSIKYLIPNTVSPNSALVDHDFAINWSMDNYYDWYRVNAKMRLSTTAITQWLTSPSQPSYDDFNIAYTTSPEITSVSNRDIYILSATALPGDTSVSSITLENPHSYAASTTLGLGANHPFMNNTVNTINSNGTMSVTTPSVLAGETLTISQTGLSVTPPSGSVSASVADDLADINYHNSAIASINITGIDRETNLNNNSNSSMVITPSQATVDVAIDTWSQTGNYYKKWTETSTTHNVNTAHTIGDLRPGQNYHLIINDVYDQSLLADGSGQVSFTYSGGFSTKTFELEEVPAAPTMGSSTALSTGSIRWSFVDNADNETGFKLYTSSDELKITDPTIDLTYIDEASLLENTQYTRYVTAYNTSGESLDSSTDAVYTLVGSPTGFTGTTSQTSVGLSVSSFANDTAGSSGYYFFQSGNEENHNSGWTQSNTWTDTDLSPNTSYTWAVKYRNGDGVVTSTASFTSNTLSLKIPTEIPIVTSPIVKPVVTSQIAGFLQDAYISLNIKDNAVTDSNPASEALDYLNKAKKASSNTEGYKGNRDWVATDYLFIGGVLALGLSTVFIIGRYRRKKQTDPLE